MDRRVPAYLQSPGEFFPHRVAADGNKEAILGIILPSVGTSQHRHTQHLGARLDAVIQDAHRRITGSADAVDDHFGVAAAADQYNLFRHVLHFP